MTAAGITAPASECELALDLLSRHHCAAVIDGIVRDAQEVRRLLHLYSFRKNESAEQLCAEISSRYREEILRACSGAMLLRRQSSSVYLRLEQLLSQLLRVAVLRLSLTGALSLSQTQLMHSDGMLLHLLRRELHEKTDG
ncbi:MAG: hypothetical protein IKU34_07505 [Clostridia bacterium]|nr:hypothetical protein [Clostridia bacterium]